MKPFKFSKKKREYVKWGKNVTEVRTLHQNADDTGKKPDIEVEADAATAGGVYSNLAAVTHTETEFVLDFLCMQPGRPKAKVGARVLSSPAHVKRLCAALRGNIKRYEARFGPIKS